MKSPSLYLGRGQNTILCSYFNAENFVLGQQRSSSHTTTFGYERRNRGDWRKGRSRGRRRQN